jgi:hypothetical protein
MPPNCPKLDQYTPVLLFQRLKRQPKGRRDILIWHQMKGHSCTGSSTLGQSIFTSPLYTLLNLQSFTLPLIQVLTKYNQGTLFSLAGYATITNFKRTSKFADILPPASDLFFHPITFFRTCIEVLKLHTAHVSAETAERRRRKVEDVQKRSEYRKKHGLEKEGIGGWTAKTNAEVLGPAIPTDDASANAAIETPGGEAMEQPEPRPKKHVKKWLGIW